ncbi:hypothetical protein ACI06P_05785 [Sphingobacterium sp. ML3W]|jgi:hypothetical protein|uniref:hypothetical protein n=1 Tax=Sphingobacterium sp. ML3W TaxID=1538644 RepID=UPI00384E9A2E
MEVRDFLRQLGKFQTLQNAKQPPWSKFPGKDNTDIFWRMGTGEEYLIEFGGYYNYLSKREQIGISTNQSTALHMEVFL